MPACIFLNNILRQQNLFTSYGIYKTTTIMILTEEQILQLKEIIQMSLDNLYQNDFELIERGGMEQAVSFRFGIYLLGHCQQVEW